MKSAVLIDVRKIEIQELEKPELNADQVLVKVC